MVPRQTNTDISLEKHPSKSDTQMKTLEVYQLSAIFLNVRRWNTDYKTTTYRQIATWAWLIYYNLYWEKVLSFDWEKLSNFLVSKLCKNGMISWGLFESIQEWTK